ncbi:MAG TPA: hypothetical protein VF417_01315, partial [Candidatus Methylomirabilis sp.]
EVQMRVDDHPRFLRRRMVIGLGIGLIAAGILLGTGVRAWRRRGQGAASSAALRIDPEDLRRRLVDAGIAVMPKDTDRLPSALAARGGRLAEATSSGTAEIHP